MRNYPSSIPISSPSRVSVLTPSLAAAEPAVGILVRLLLVGLLAGLLLPNRFAVAGPAHPALAADQRALIIESSLKDISTSNDAAIADQQLLRSPSVDALGQPRLDLSNERPVNANADAEIRAEVDSSLHRLRRETAISQSTDDQRSQIEETLDRAAQTP